MTQRLAIVERLPGHTEIMGAFASMALELGYDTHLLFNSEDPFHVVKYLQKRIPIAADNIHDWSYINTADSQFDVILLNTSFVWLDYGRVLQQWNATKRLIAVHHNPDDVELTPHGAAAYLTPVAGKEKWIFPMYGQPAALAEPEEAALSSPGGEDLPVLTTIGSLDLKDIDDVGRYMKAGGKVVHYDRHKCHHFPNHDGIYTQHIGLNGTQFMASLAQLKSPIFLWFPIVPKSDYMVCRFTGALLIGVDMNCIMVMPERLRKFYEFPEEAVITYDDFILEVECQEKLHASPVKQQQRRRELWNWADERWRQNISVFQKLLGRQGSTAQPPRA